MCVFVWKGWKGWRNSEREGWMMMGKKRFERKTNGWINKWINGWINGWMDESINKWMNESMDGWITQLTTNDWIQQTIPLPRIRIPLVNSNPHILHIGTERTLLQAILDQHSDFYPSTIAFNATDRNVHRNLRAHSINYHFVELRITSPPFSVTSSRFTFKSQ